MSCADQIVPIATNIIKLLLQLPSEEIFEEVKVPVQTVAESSVAVSYTTQRRTRRGLARRHESLTNFLLLARRVGLILKEYYDITVLTQGGGPTMDSMEDTAGVRFLERLIESTFAGKERIPPLGPRLRRICQIFEAQILAKQVDVDWIYPLPGFRLADSVRLSRSVRLQQLSSASMERLSDYGEGGLTAQNLLLQTFASLTISATASMPFSRSGDENSDTLHKFRLAFILGDLPSPLWATFWPESREPSVFELGQAFWFAPWSASPLVFFRNISLTPLQVAAIRRVYRRLDSCSAKVLNSLPVRRLISASHRGVYEDKIIDLWIALESLLLTNDEKSEMQYRMTNRAAWIVQPTDLQTFRKMFSKSYDDRSKVVHGGRHKLDQNAINRLDWTFSILKTILLHCISKDSLTEPVEIDEAMLTQKLKRA